MTKKYYRNCLECINESFYEKTMAGYGLRNQYEDDYDRSMAITSNLRQGNRISEEDYLFVENFINEQIIFCLQRHYSTVFDHELLNFWQSIKSSITR